MSIERVRPFLAAFGREQDILEFPVSSATVDLAAAALNTAPARIAKTMSFADGEGCLVIVTAGDTKIDNSKFKAAFGFKAKMLSADQTLAFTGHAVGGVCPFALPKTVRIFLDESLRRFETVFSCRRQFQLRHRSHPGTVGTIYRWHLGGCVQITRRMKCCV